MECDSFFVCNTYFGHAAKYTFRNLLDDYYNKQCEQNTKHKMTSMGNVGELWKKNRAEQIT